VPPGCSDSKSAGMYFAIVIGRQRRAIPALHRTRFTNTEA